MFLSRLRPVTVAPAQIFILHLILFALMVVPASALIGAEPHPALAARAAINVQAPMWPGVSYSYEIPTIESVLSYAKGTQISSHAQIRKYFEALSKSAPERIRLFDYAESWEGRTLFYAVLGSAANIERLDAIQTNIQTLAAGGSVDAKTLSELPATVWLSYGVHGNEISSPEAAMVTAWHLLAAQDDQLVDGVMQNTLVFINPLQNPDGRDRFVQQFRQASGPFPDASRFAAEHDEPWPSGRVNHYLFDLNRDWLAITQPETAGHIKAVQQWYPLAFVDAHEMGSDDSYFFAPEAIPYNPHLVNSQRETLQLFGRNNARWFDAYGFDYFTREVFDAFYPGYGASWPSYYGGIAMTYEQGSARGLVVRRRDGELLSYRETVRHHFVASIATAQTVSENREQLWQNFIDYRRSAINADSNSGPASYIIPTQSDQGGAHDLGLLLRQHGADVWISNASFSACGKDYAAGSMVVNLNQPQRRLLRVLLDQQVDMDADFIATQLKRAQRGLADEIYDVTAWSLPLMFNVTTLPCSRTINTSNMRLLNRAGLATTAALPQAKVAYLIKGQDRRTNQVLAELLQRGINIKSSHLPITINDQQYPSGSLIIPVLDNVADIHQQVRSLTTIWPDLRIIALDNSWVTDGPSFGSDRTASLFAPKVALAWDSPTDGYSPGATRFVLERQFNYPVTPIRADNISRVQLDDFDVLILPDSRGEGYSTVFAEPALTALKGWIERGGVLVTIANAARWAAAEEVGLLTSKQQLKVTSATAAQSPATETGAEAPAGAGNISSADEYQQWLEPDETPPQTTSGVLVKAIVDREHWMSASVADYVNVLVRGNTMLDPVQLDAGNNVVRFAPADELIQSGYLWPDNIPQLAWKPFVMVQPQGKGMVIGFSEDPTIRAYLNGLNTLFSNAVLRAPAYTGKLH
jgi:hypothetical protein